MHRRPFAARVLSRSEDVLAALRDGLDRADSAPLALVSLAKAPDEYELITATMLLEHEGLAIVSPLLVDHITDEHTIELTSAGRELAARDRADIQAAGSTTAREMAELTLILGAGRGHRWGFLSEILRTSAVVLEVLAAMSPARREHFKPEEIAQRRFLSEELVSLSLGVMALEGYVEPARLGWSVTPRGVALFQAMARDLRTPERAVTA